MSTTNFGNNSGGSGSNNSAFGYYTSHSNAGTCNTSVGSNALLVNASGNNNTSVGAGSMCNVVVGSLNTAVGANALEGNLLTANLSQNVAIGVQSLFLNEGSNNTAVGAFSLLSNVGGENNVAVGNNAGNNNKNNNNYNTFLGTNAISSLDNTTNSTAIGANAITNASNQIMLGGLTSGNYPTVVVPSGQLNMANDCVIYSSSGAAGTLVFDISGNTDIFMNEFGLNSAAGVYGPLFTAYIVANGTAIVNGLLDVTGTANVNGLLDVSGNATVTGTINNISVFGNGNYNTGVGTGALINNSGGNNTALGYNVLSSNSSFGNNTAIGSNSMTATIGNANTAVGSNTLSTNTTGRWNTAMGLSAMSILTTGQSNVAIGMDTLNNNVTGSNNTALGFNAGSYDISGNYNTYLGYGTSKLNNSSIYTNSTALGYEAVINASNQIVLGTASESVQILGSYVGIGGLYNILSGYALDVSGNIHATGTVTATNIVLPSDHRIKENVQPLDFTVDNLRPVTYKNKLLDKQDIGFIAHELQEELPFLVTGVKDGEELQTVNYIGIIGILVKEVQDLKKQMKLLLDNKSTLSTF